MTDHDGRLAALFPDPWHSTDEGLNAFASDVSSWHARELPGAPTWARVSKVAEEAGELVGALLKVRQQQENGYRPACGAAEALGVTDVDALVARRWADVRARRFATAGAP